MFSGAGRYSFPMANAPPEKNCPSEPLLQKYEESSGRGIEDWPATHVMEGDLRE